MKVCGIDLKASNAILAVIEKKDEESVFIPLEIKKIALDANDDQKEMIQFYDNISGFLKVNLINKVVIKKRAKKGNFSGGANTFKMEAAIQLSGICDVSLLSSQSISSYEKKIMLFFLKKLKNIKKQLI